MTLQKGFTLIELLVVVLIIGILSAIALPQYTVAVEKSRMAEGLENGSSLRKAVDLYLLANDYPEDGVVYFLGNDANGSGTLDIDFESSLDCTQASGHACSSKNFVYGASCNTTICEVVAHRKQGGQYTNPLIYRIYWNKSKSTGQWDEGTCMYNETDSGLEYSIKLCKQLQAQGWTMSAD